MTRVAIIGAGLTGLCLAQLLHSHGSGIEVTVFEKARGPGGRMATRRADEWYFEHGTQFFTARHPAFRRFLAPYLDAGLIQPWQPKLVGLSPNEPLYRRAWFEPHYIAVPTMNSLTKSLAAPLAVVLQHEVKALERHGREWVLHFANGQISEPFDWVLCTVPAPMAVPLLPREFSGHAALRRVRYAPCTMLMLGFDSPLPLPWDAARVHDSVLTWVARGSSRDSHPGPESLVLQSSNQWSHRNADAGLATVSETLETALRALPGLEELPEPSCRYIHRWRYARLLQRAEAPAYADTALQLGACGEWGLAGSVESCFLSALALYQRLEPLRGGLHASALLGEPLHHDELTLSPLLAKTLGRQS